MTRKIQKSSSSEDYIYSDDIGVLELTPGGRAECARPGLFRHPKFRKIICLQYVGIVN